MSLKEKIAKLSFVALLLCITTAMFYNPPQEISNNGDKTIK